MVDDLRPMLGCYGDQRMRTPNIDRLAEQGVVFERAYCQYAKCGTSRLSMLTGLRPDSIGVFSNNVREVVRFRKRRPDAVSLPRWLKQHGYDTRSFGKIYHDGWDDPDDWSVASFPGREGEMLEVVDPTRPDAQTIIAERLNCPVMQSPEVADNHLFAGRMADRVIAELPKRTELTPRFLAVGFRRPHLPFVAPRRYYDLYEPTRDWLAMNQQPPVNSPVMAWFNGDGYLGTARRVGLVMPPRPNRSEAVDWNGYELRSYVGAPNHGPIPDDFQLKLLHAYAACVSYVDAQIGRILTTLDESPRFANTVVILCSDHGWHLGEHSAWSKMTNFEVATRVPLIVSGPGVSTGHTKTIAELVDLYPTVCSLVDLPMPPHLQGDSLVAALKEPRSTDANGVAISQYSRFRGAYTGTALRTDTWRFVSWVDSDTGRVVHRELYDHSKDSTESMNLAGDPEYNHVVDEHRKMLQRHVRARH